MVDCFRPVRFGPFFVTGTLAILVLGPSAGPVVQAAPGGRIRGEACAGEPFGVGRIEVELPEALLPEPLGLAGLGVAARDDRLFYPALEPRLDVGVVRDVLSQSRRPVLRIIGEVLPDGGKTNVFFLFRGREALEVSVRSRRVDPLVLQPVADPAGHRRLLAGWWKSYTAGPGLLKRSDYPPLVENYLQSMLARRLGLALARQPNARPWEEQYAEELRLAGQTELLRMAYQRERFLGPRPADEAADQPLPDPIAAPELDVPAPAGDVKVEPLAMRVPAECLYVRFGSFSNFLWFQDTLARWGGDLANLLAGRGLDRGLRDRFQKQLVLQTTVLARLFGEQVIGDVAIVATDPFFVDGGAYGVLFQARSSLVLGNDFTRQRQERLNAGGGVTDERVKIGGHDVSVSFLSSPDGAVRSYYVPDGDYHFVTTSRTLARRFLETRSGKGSLGATREFRHARTLMPLERSDAAFVCLSSRFFENFVSPAYRVEMTRRLVAQADVELAQMALLASAAEKQEEDSVEALVGGGFLPAGFGVRPDGSRTVIVEDEASDSLRGEPGAFLPIPDVEVGRVTRSEAQSYRRFAEYYASQWERLNPIFAGIQRKALPGDREQVTLDVRMTPLARRQYESLARLLGPADKKRLAPIPGDAVALEVVLPGARVFGGLQSLGPAVELIRGELVPFGRLRNLVVGYVGTTGDLGPLGFLNRRVTGPADAEGFARGEAGLWRRGQEPFSVFSFQRDLLEKLSAELRFVEADRPAQLRLRVADLSETKIAPLANAWGYARSRETSLGNVRLLEQMTGQLHVPADLAKDAAELLLGAKLICPLGGQYVRLQTPEGASFWTSTALKREPKTGSPLARTPPGFLAPPLNWFRGLDLEALVEPEALSIHAQVLMQMPRSAPSASSPP